MKIQFVCQHYYPDNFLITGICEELAKRGHNVSVLTGQPDCSTGYIPNEYKFFRKRKENINGVNVIRVPVFARRKGKILRAINYLSFYINSSLYALFHSFDCDLIFAYQLAPIIMVNSSFIIKKKTNKPIFLYCLDPWPDQLKVWNVNENNILFKIVHTYCKYAYKFSDLIGISSKPFKKYLVNINGVNEDKIIYLPQHAEQLNIEKTTINEDCVDIVYAGSIGIQQNLDCLLHAISKIKTKNNYHFHVCGNGTELEYCKSLANILKINKFVTFYGRIEKQALKDIYSLADAFVITLAPENRIGYSANSIPARFQSYISTGKPVIASIDGGTKQIIEESNCGIVANAGDIDGLANILSEYINDPHKYLEYGLNGKNLYNANFKKDIVLDNIEEILSNLVNNK